MKIERYLPNNEYLAAIGANSPSAVNPYATINDLPSPVVITDDVIPRGDGTSVEDGTWNNVGNDIRPITTGSNIGDATHRIGTLFMSSTVDHTTDLNFNVGANNFHTFLANGQSHLSKTGGTFKVGLSTFAQLEYSAGVLSHTTPSGLGSTWVGFATYHNTLSTQVGLFANKFGYNALRYSHDYRWETWTGGVGAGSTERMRLDSNGNLSIAAPTSLARLTVRGVDTSQGIAAMYVAGSSGDMGIQVQNDSRVGVGAMGSTSTKFNVRGSGTTSATTAFNVEGYTGQDKFLIRDNGQQASASGSNTASFQSAFGRFHETVGTVATPFSFGTGIYSGVNVSTTLLVTHRGGGSNRIALDAGLQGAPTGTATAIRGFQSTSGMTTSIGINGIARNGTTNNWAIYGQVGGGWSAAAAAAPPTDVRAVYGAASANVDTINYGGYFTGSGGSAAVNNGKDKIGVFAQGSKNSIASGETGISIGGQFRTQTVGGSGAGTGNMAIHVPSTSNDGTVVFGADTVSINASMLEVTGDSEILGGGNGLILPTQDGTKRYKYEADNTNGTWVITLLP